MATNPLMTGDVVVAFVVSVKRKRMRLNVMPALALIVSEGEVLNTESLELILVKLPSLSAS